MEDQLSTIALEDLRVGDVIELVPGLLEGAFALPTVLTVIGTQRSDDVTRVEVDVTYGGIRVGTWTGSRACAGTVWAPTPRPNGKEAVVDG